MIITFKCADTEALANLKRVKRSVNTEAVARRKLRQLQIANRLEDLRVPPGNRLGGEGDVHKNLNNLTDIQ